MYLTKNNASLFSKVVVPIFSPSSNVQKFQLFYITNIFQHPASLIVASIVVLHCDLNLYFLVINVEKEMATHSSILAWRIPWTEEPGGLHCPWGHKQSDMTEGLTIVNEISTYLCLLAVNTADKVRCLFILLPSFLF